MTSTFPRSLRQLLRHLNANPNVEISGVGIPRSLWIFESWAPPLMRFRSPRSGGVAALRFSPTDGLAEVSVKFDEFGLDFNRGQSRIRINYDIEA